MKITRSLTLRANAISCVTIISVMPSCASDSTTRKIVRGPQPEIVREYELFLDEQLVVSVTDNYLRKRVHRLNAPVAARRLRLVAKSTHGASHARVFEIRAYGA